MTTSSYSGLMDYLVWEICEKGIRTLYYHPYRKLVNDSTNEDHITIFPTNGTFKQGDE